MADTFDNASAGLTSPASHIAAAVLNDAVDLASSSRSLFFEVGGAVKLTTVGGETVTMNVPANFVLPLRVKRIWAAGTTIAAASIWVLW